jgi:hypothetical protein
MTKPVSRVKNVDQIKPEKINEMIERINELEKRLGQLESKTPIRMPSTLEPLYHIDSVQ